MLAYFWFEWISKRNTLWRASRRCSASVSSLSSCSRTKSSRTSSAPTKLTCCSCSTAPAKVPPPPFRTQDRLPARGLPSQQQHPHGHHPQSQPRSHHHQSHRQLQYLALHGRLPAQLIQRPQPILSARFGLTQLKSQGVDDQYEKDFGEWVGFGKIRVM